MKGRLVFRSVVVVALGAASGCTCNYGASGDGGGEAAVPDAGPDVQSGPGPAPEGGCTSSAVVFDQAIAVSASELYTCAIRQDGSLWCWGDNAFGQLGVPQPTTLGTSKPQKVAFPASFGDAKITRVVLGAKTTFAIDSLLRLWVWGSNESGLLGTGATDPNAHAEPIVVQLAGSPMFVQRVAVLYGSVCALATTNDIYCWGENFSGQLGPLPAPGRATTPTKAFFTTRPATTAALLASGIASPSTCYSSGNLADGIQCWGETGGGVLLLDRDGGFGAGTNDKAADSLVDAGAAMPVRDLQFGTNYGCALDAMGHLFCWGPPEAYDTLGVSSPPAGRAAIVPGLWGSMATGLITLCAVDDQKVVRCRGLNQHGELGRSTGDAGSDPRMDPVVLPDGGPLDHATGLGAGFFHVCAILEGTCGGGPVVCWGNNNKGQLGADAGPNSVSPVFVEAP